MTIMAAAVVFMGSCKKTDDYFISPNEPSELTMPVLLSSTEVGTMNTYEGEIARTASILVQQNVGAQFQSQDPQFYNLIEDQFNNQWKQLYQTLENARQLEALAGTANPHYRGLSRVLSAMNWGLLTDMWGDIPYTEALKIKEGIISPKFDQQQVVLAGIINMLDMAIADFAQPLSANVKVPGGEDIIFGGDMAMWNKTAHTLKARYLNRYSNKSTYDPTAIIAALSNGIQSSSENCMAIHADGNALNQWFAFENSRGYIVSCQTFVDSLLLRPQDLRIEYYFSTNDSGKYVGSPVDVTNDDATISRWGTYLVGSGSAPFPLVTYSEAKFIEAEALNRSGNPLAADALNDAIKASCSEVSGGAYDGVDIAVYTPATIDMSRIIYEKWLSLFGQPEAYTDYRRTGYPNLTPNAQGQISEIPKRFPVPQDERVNNPNAPSPAITTPVWWAQ